MSYINGVLTVPSFDAGVAEGEFTITGATYTNYADTSGSGAFAIELGWLLYVQASDAATFLQIPGLAHRFKVTAIEVIDPTTVNLTVLWDEPGPVVDSPTNGVDAIITSVSAIQKYGYSVDTTLYPSLPVGLVTGMLNQEVQDITDNLSGGGGGAVLSVNDKVGAVVIQAGAGIQIDTSGAQIIILSTGDNEGTYQ